MGVLVILLVVVLAVFSIYVNYRIVDKAGYNGWWALLMILPLVNLVMIWVFAFKPWPAVDGPPVRRPQGPLQPPPGMQAKDKDDFQAPPPPPPPTNA
jgi:amino acid transporter